MVKSQGGPEPQNGGQGKPLEPEAQAALRDVISRLQNAIIARASGLSAASCVREEDVFSRTSNWSSPTNVCSDWWTLRRSCPRPCGRTRLSSGSPTPWRWYLLWLD